MSDVIEILVHLDATDAGEPVWWAECPQIPGFSAAESTLAGLEAISERATREIAGDLGITVERVAFRLVALEALTGNPARAMAISGPTTGTNAGSGGRITVTEPQPLCVA